jgi:UTP--glucose-1-phosphate uridylyltransferase
MEIIKAIIPAAGLGTRFLPYTKSVPKEMLPIGTKPAIQCIVEEALAASLSSILIVTSKGKDALADYFDASPYLENLLKERHKHNLLSELTQISHKAQFTYIRQPEPMGLGHAVWMARHSIGKEYCAVMLPDDILLSKNSGIGQLVRIARQERASVIAVREVPMEEVSSYGIVTIRKHITPNLFQVGHLVEKPQPKDAPSNLAIVGRYVLSHKIFPALEEVSSYAVGELQLTDAIDCMIQNNERVFAYKIQGPHFDIGTMPGWLYANMYYGLHNPETAPKLRALLSKHENINIVPATKIPEETTV